ncbi:CopD family protein [Reinekea blandensis]|uniref:Copper resistance protein D domain-containing protein n=1 Tax=Reinekea blandensis MED297 TaxID=314283 RepID=A4BIK7_9GAMM|nr:CopD family protein [Reinekea blandensis]EAR08086.1 hypothetical protein MED297_07581 [Reinekea sp. MED297] [Reinekea blandensis MED297]
MSFLESQWLLIIHVLAATVWTGGHLVLATVILPTVLRDRSVSRLLAFESAYERIGMPALLLQVVTGVALAYRLIPDVSAWFDWSNPIARAIIAKLTLLLLTVVFALDARFRVIPGLTERGLVDMAWHIVPVTVLSVLFVVVGVSFRGGGLGAF